MQGGRALVAIRGILGDQLQDDLVDEVRNRVVDRARPDRLDRHMGMEPLLGRRGLQRRLPRGQLIEDDPQRIQIASVIAAWVVATGLLRRRIHEILGRQGRCGSMPGLSDRPGRAEAAQPDAPCRIHDEVRRPDIAMNEPARVQLRQRGRGADRNIEEIGH